MLLFLGSISPSIASPEAGGCRAAFLVQLRKDGRRQQLEKGYR